MAEGGGARRREREGGGEGEGTGEGAGEVAGEGEGEEAGGRAPHDRQNSYHSRNPKRETKRKHGGSFQGMESAHIRFEDPPDSGLRN